MSSPDSKPSVDKHTPVFGQSFKLQCFAMSCVVFIGAVLTAWPSLNGSTDEWARFSNDHNPEMIAWASHHLSSVLTGKASWNHTPMFAWPGGLPLDAQWPWLAGLFTIPFAFLGTASAAFNTVAFASVIATTAVICWLARHVMGFGWLASWVALGVAVFPILTRQSATPIPLETGLIALIIGLAWQNTRQTTKVRQLCLAGATGMLAWWHPLGWLAIGLSLMTAIMASKAGQNIPMNFKPWWPTGLCLILVMVPAIVFRTNGLELGLVDVLPISIIPGVLTITAMGLMTRQTVTWGLLATSSLAAAAFEVLPDSSLLFSLGCVASGITSGFLLHHMAHHRLGVAWRATLLCLVLAETIALGMLSPARTHPSSTRPTSGPTIELWGGTPQTQWIQTHATGRVLSNQHPISGVPTPDARGPGLLAERLTRVVLNRKTGDIARTISVLNAFQFTEIAIHRDSFNATDFKELTKGLARWCTRARDQSGSKTWWVCTLNGTPTVSQDKAVKQLNKWRQEP